VILHQKLFHRVFISARELIQIKLPIRDWTVEEDATPIPLIK
jgi:hypothetical protein